MKNCFTLVVFALLLSVCFVGCKEEIDYGEGKITQQQIEGRWIAQEIWDPNTKLWENIVFQGNDYIYLTLNNKNEFFLKIVGTRFDGKYTLANKNEIRLEIPISAKQSHSVRCVVYAWKFNQAEFILDDPFLRFRAKRIVE